jgi:5-methylcytosine-specific restriction endonuclease McrA
MRRRKRLTRRDDQIRELDRLLRQAVLLRDGFQCRRCGANRWSRPQPALQAAHIKPKGAYPALRYELKNVLCLCAKCHVYGKGAWHKDPTAAADWARQHLGDAYLQQLQWIANVRKRPDRAAEKLMLEMEIEKFMNREKAE